MKRRRNARLYLKGKLEVNKIILFFLKKKNKKEQIYFNIFNLIMVFPQK